MYSQPQSEKRAIIQNTARGEPADARPDVALLSEKQWSYIRRRYRMSPRELQVAKLVCHGFTNGNMAERLHVKPGTVKTHLRSIFSKTRARNKITMLLTFMDDVSKLSGVSNNTASIRIIDGDKPTTKKSFSDQTIPKE
jgi:DNA-binding NarL/FixJ family response regulator